MLTLARHRRRTWFIVVLASVLVAACGVVAWWLLWRSPVQPAQPAVTTPPQPTTASVETKLLVMGDVYWGRYINDWSMASEQKYAYPFHRLSEFKRDNYDAWIADLECPVTNNPKVSSAVEDDTLKFDCSPAYLEEAKKWFTAFTLANNHTDNQGLEGLQETRQHLDEQGVQYFGDFEPERFDDICEVLSLPARVGLTDGTTKQGKLPLVWCGYHGVFKTPSAESVAVIKRYSDLFPVVAMPHSGAEYKAEPDEIKSTFYHALIDGGADVVLGDHPHWVQSTEAYKGKLIVYSLGNFIFDQQFNPEVTRSAAVDMTLSVAAADAPDLDEWLALGETCAAYHDDCLRQATDQHLTKLSLKFHFGVVGSNNSGKIVHRATDTELESIKQRLRWQQTIQQLTGSNSGE